jgi:Cd2+/Zn2+-exporting ATPase
MNDAAVVEGRSEKTVTDIWARHGAAMSAAICAVLTLLAWHFGEQGLTALEVPLYLTAYFIGGYRKAREGLQTLIKERDLDVDLLMIVAAVGAASIGYWQDGAILIFIFSLSGALEGYTTEKTNNDIRSIMKLRPETALVLRGNTGSEERVRVEKLQPGDLVLVKPGERIPADGKVRQGYSSVDQASITGESIPVDKASGDEVFAGTINGHGALTIEVTKPAEVTLLARIIRLVQEAQSEMPPSQLFVEKFERIYVRVVVAAALLLLVIPPYTFGWTWDKTVYRTMIFLVVASPCALVASIMPAILSGISNGARKGILFKGGVHLENIGDVKLVAFDKTGTLTEGKPAVTNIVPLLSQSEDELLRLTAALEILSEHPIAKAIVQAAKERGLELPPAAELQAIPGVGVHGLVDQKEFLIGHLDCLHNLSEEHCQLVKQLEQQGKTVIYVQSQHRLIGLLAIQDTLRPQARNAIKALHRMGIGVAMLTGDNSATARAIGRQAGVDWIYADLFPEQKMEIVKKLAAAHGKIAMVGDGVNDAPALATAGVGIAMGAAGTDVALETANVVLMADDIEKVAAAIELGRRTKKIVKQNIIFAMGVVLLLVAGTFLDNVNLPFGVIGHEGSTLLVIANGLRLLR